MAELEQLISMAALLGHDKATLMNQTEVQLLRSIIQKVDDRKLTTEIPDSLAFPQDVRDKYNLKEAKDLWDKLDTINNQLKEDYTSRRRMSLDRLDRLAKSFEGRNKSTNEKVVACYKKAKKSLTDETQVTLPLLLATRETDCDSVLNGVVSSQKLDCRIKYQRGDDKDGMINLKRVIIPHVPERGDKVNRKQNDEDDDDDEVGPSRGRSRGRGGHKRGGGHRGRR